MFAYVILASRIVCVIGLCSLGGVRDSSAQVGFVSPVLTSVVANVERGEQISVTGNGEIVVTGVGFSPGEPVYVVVHDQWDNVGHETRWVTASMPVLQPPQVLAPGEGFSVDSGGNIAEFFEIPAIASTYPLDTQNPALGPVTSQSTTTPGVTCDVLLLVRAYDRLSATWSNIVEVDLGC